MPGLSLMSPKTFAGAINRPQGGAGGGGGVHSIL